LCGTLDINADAIGTLYTITGTQANAMVADILTGPDAQAQFSNPIIMAPGTIDLDCVGTDTTARIEWHIVYRALEAGATVVAA
jgi:hypothetical protein